MHSHHHHHFFFSLSLLVLHPHSQPIPSQSSMNCTFPGSSGPVLGCTAPQVSQEGDVIVFIADGRFRLEALMIANPTIPAYALLGSSLLASRGLPYVVCLMSELTPEM